MSIDLNEVETHEDVQAVVADVLAQQKDEEATDKSDAAKIAEEGDREAAERDNETEAPEPEEEEVDERAWLNDDLKNQVTAYGIDEDELEDFTSREEVERAMRFLDRSAQEAGQKARDETGKFVKKTPEEPEGEEASKPDGRYEIKLDTEEWSGELLDEFTQMRDHYESRVAGLEARFADQDAKLEEQHFDSLIDSLGHKDLFGTTGKETKKELTRREDVIIAAKAQQIGLEQMGRPVDLDEALMARVANMVFADELGKKKIKARTKRLTKQSNGRMGGSATKPHEAPETPEAKALRYYKSLEEQSG